MDPNQQKPQPSIQIVNQQPVPTPASSGMPPGGGQEQKKGGFLAFFLILLLIAVVVAGGIYYFLVLNNQTITTYPGGSTISPYPTRMATPTLSPDQAVDSLDTGTVDEQVSDIEQDLQGL